MLLLLPNKESVRLYLRRHILRESTNRDQLRCLQDCLEEPKPRHSRTWLALIIPIVYTVYILVGKITLTTGGRSGTVGVTDAVGTLMKNGSKVGPRHLGIQIVAPDVKANNDIDESLEWYHEDLHLRTYLLKIKMLQNEHKNIFTPKSAFDFTEVPTTTTEINAKDNLPVCKGKYNYTGGGNISVNLSPYNGSLEELYPMINQGGHYRPDDCWSRHKVAILVPYRNRRDNLITFLINIHPFLMAQKLEYRIFVIEQHDKNKFNKGRLLNAGFEVMKKLGDWPCVVLHDVDLLPLNPLIMYSCSTYPRLMSSALYFPNRTFNNVSDSPRRFGGVAAISLQQYERVNGHSNLYRGWGNEDADLYIRLRSAGLRVTTNNKNISRFVQLPHARENNQDINWSLLLNAPHRYRNEGLSTLEYKVLNVTYHHLFTRILVVLDEMPLRNIFSMFSHKLPKHPPRLKRPSK